MANQAVRITFKQPAGIQIREDVASVLMTTSLSGDTNVIDTYVPPTVLLKLKRMSGITVEELEKLPRGAQTWSGNSWPKNRR